MCPTIFTELSEKVVYNEQALHTTSVLQISVHTHRTAETRHDWPTHKYSVYISDERPLSSLRKIPRLFQVFPTEALTLIKPPGVYRPTCTPEWILWHYWQSILCMSTLLNSTQVVYFVTITMTNAEANHNFPDFSSISLTNVKSPTFPGFPGEWPP